MNEPLLKSNFFSAALVDNPAVLPVRAELVIAEEAAGQVVLAVRDLALEYFASLGFCELVAEENPRPILTRYWGGEDCDRLFTHYQQVVWQVCWNKQSLQVVHLEWETGCGGESRNWVVAQDRDLAEAFLLDVERKTHTPGEAILVFSSGHWHRSEALYAATQAASFDDLVLADDLKETIRNDFRQFLSAEERYNKLGIAWRRGALLIGPPGNGKTHCVRALVKELGVSSLYVQSLRHPYQTAEQMWQQVFKRARGLRPCVLVLEDLDSLVTPENRSFFLNQLDGFEQNHGLIVLATTNYPERIDAAIINRPSRFDRKYHFSLPTYAERLDYLESWQQRLSEEVGWDQDDLPSVATLTEGFSFAYLKELVISTVMSWMQDSAQSFILSMQEMATMLQNQMQTEPEPLTEEFADESEDFD